MYCGDNLGDNPDGAAIISESSNCISESSVFISEPSGNVVNEG
jgi:hypothetical protein